MSNTQLTSAGELNGIAQGARKEDYIEDNGRLWRDEIGHIQAEDAEAWMPVGVRK